MFHSVAFSAERICALIKTMPDGKKLLWRKLFVAICGIQYGFMLTTRKHRPACSES
jgi:hypothetical protein